MKSIIITCMIITCMIILSFSYGLFSKESQSESKSPAPDLIKEKIGIIIYSNDPETVWNAFRIANYSLDEGDTASVFLLGKGVEITEIVNSDFNIKESMKTFLDNGGKILACGTCLFIRINKDKSNLCAVSTLTELYNIIKKSDRILTF